MIRTVTAVSEVQEIIGNLPGIPLGLVSHAVRMFNYDTARAVEYLLKEAENRKNNPVKDDVPEPSAPQNDIPVIVPNTGDERVKCGFCEVLNPTINTKCFVCDSELPPRKQAANNGNNNNNNNNGNGNNNNSGKNGDTHDADGRPKSMNDIEIPAELYADGDLTQSTELAIKRMLWEEEEERRKAVEREEELTTKYLMEEQKKRQAALDQKKYDCGICFSECNIEEMYILEDCFHKVSLGKLFRASKVRFVVLVLQGMFVPSLRFANQRRKHARYCLS